MASTNTSPAPRRAILLPLALFAAFALVPLLAHLSDDRFLMLFVTRIMIFAIVALSLDFILGYGALVSFGHAAFVGIGAYAVGILAEGGQAEGLVAFPVAIAAAGIFALITGAISLKTRGVYFIMITLAFGQMAYFTATSLSAYGGDDGLTIWGRNSVLGADLLSDDRTFFYVVLAALGACYLMCRMIIASRFGRVLRAAKQSESRLAAIGINPFGYRLTAYAIAGMIAGLGGAFLANHTEFVSPAYMNWHRSGELIVMVMLGGMGTLHGAILGAAAYLLLEENLSQVSEHWRVVFGPFLIVVVLYARGGLTGFLNSLQAGRRKDD
ncbi:branched-chain amino acid ABC transporter permease [Breoghania sp. L-A4]|uniref:branched-chain amino acid ABC transporter permease n=1 Tax=Breoghania sp. L-A4 TaxID=2304600 RepID=UPI000E35A210|nr:branched-chain amino acid ABC transporter permease [Breoghania sp. L-A4]AXS40019.1 branched-chain amino acid ABC transporter permease [Breoghania sp. L-A4]